MDNTDKAIFILLAMKLIVAIHINGHLLF